MKFLTAYSEKVSYPSEVGVREYTEQRVVFSPDGNMSLKDGCKRDRQDEINSFKDDCIVSNLVKRYENGDQMALMRGMKGAFCDLREMPENIHQATKLMRNVEGVYNRLPDHVRSSYTDLNSFLECFVNQEKFDSFVKKFDVQRNVKTKEVNENA